MLSRRELVGKLAAGTAAVCAVGVAKTSLGSTRIVPESPTGAAPDEAQLALTQTDVAVSNASPPALGPGLDEGIQATLNASAPWELLQPLAMGSVVSHGWRVAAFTGAVDGSCVLTLQNERGRSHRVHICRNDGRPTGLIYTKSFDLVVMNGGQGDLPTEEGFAQAVAEVAHVLAANENDRRQAPVVAALMPHAERMRLFSGSVDARLR